jgi:hypothetical protein
MDEMTWRSTTTDRTWMLEHVRTTASERKLRLFGCACLRRVWEQLTPGGQHAVETAERVAEGLMDKMALRDELAWLNREVGSGLSVMLWEATSRPLAQGRWPPTYTAMHVLTALYQSNWRAELAAQCDLVRCLFGNPFRLSRLDSAWLEHDRGAVRNLARVIREEARFADLPILGDALEDAGCADEQILAHCRESVGHARGCWVVDLLLGAS